MTSSLNMGYLFAEPDRIHSLLRRLLHRSSIEGMVDTVLYASIEEEDFVAC